MAKSIRKKLENKLDKLWRKARGHEYCEICKTLPLSKRVNYTKLDNHHIIGRKNNLLRWDLRNRLKVCSYHHTMGGAQIIVQDNSGGWFLNWESDDDWMGKYRPEDKEYLREMRKQTFKHWTIQELEDKVKELKL